MFIESSSLIGSSLQRSEMHCFEVLHYQYLALRWSAKQFSRPRVYKHWLRWSQRTVIFTFDPLPILFAATELDPLGDCMK